MIEKIKNTIRFITKNFKAIFKELYISSKFLLIVALICFSVIAGSVFVPELNATGNIVTIRTLFSSIIGFVLENTSRKILCDDHFLILKNYSVGMLAVAITIVVVLSAFFSIDVNNPSLILFKNLLFSSVGFLISSSKECEK